MVQSSGDTLNSDDADLIFEEMADWEDILKGNPDIAKELRAFKAAAFEDDDQGGFPEQSPQGRSPVRGPSP